MVSKGRFKETEFEAPIITPRTRNMSEELKKDLAIYSVNERKAIFTEIQKGNVPGVSYDEKNKMFDYNGKTEKMKETSQRKAWVIMDSVADAVQNKERKIALATEKADELAKLLNSIAVKTDIEKELKGVGPTQAPKDTRTIKYKEEELRTVKLGESTNPSASEMLDEAMAKYGTKNRDKQKELENKTVDDIFKDASDYAQRGKKKKEK